MTRRAFLAGVPAAGIGLAVYAGTRARHHFEILNRTFAIRNLPDAFQNFRFVQISDLHLKEYTEAWFLEEIVRQVNALEPELVVITGDYVSDGPLPYSYAWRAAGVCAEILGGLNAPQRFGILGNHDVSVGSAHVIPPLEAHGLPILVNRYVPIERGGDRLWLCGTDDAREGHPDLNLAVPASAKGDPVILLCHEPDYADDVRLHPRFPAVDLMLSGHTHGGQVRLPFVGPMFLPPLGRKYIEGRFQFGHMQLYVNRGVGTVALPFRFECPPEITQITLVRA
jgi:predicted MPP superfamily phosphohydrolase